MRYHISTALILQEFAKTDSECPLCEMRSIVEKNVVEQYLNEAVMVTGVRYKVNEKGFTLVPLKLYFKDALVKVEVALCRGKQTVDKKNTLKERDLNRDSQRQLKEYSR
jgi:tmRNA-binding protein